MAVRNEPRWATTPRSAGAPLTFPCCASRGTRRIVGRAATIPATPQDYRIYRGKTRILRDRGSAEPTAQESTAGTALPPGVARRVDLGILVLSAGLARPSTLRGDRKSTRLNSSH